MACPSCKQPDNSSMVECVRCHDRYHTTCCAKPFPARSAPNWECLRCLGQTKSIPKFSTPSTTPTTSAPVTTTASITGSTGSVVTTSSSSSPLTTLAGGQPSRSNLTKRTPTKSTTANEDQLAAQVAQLVQQDQQTRQMLKEMQSNAVEKQNLLLQSEGIRESQADDIRTLRENVRDLTARLQQEEAKRTQHEVREAELRRREQELRDQELKLAEASANSDVPRRSTSSSSELDDEEPEDLQATITRLRQGQEEMQAEIAALKSTTPSIPLNSDPLNTFLNALNSVAASIGNQQSSRPTSSVDGLALTMKQKLLLTLPKFDGNLKEWAFFEKEYNRTTESGQFQPAQNIIRLREALSGKAYDLVRDKILYSSDPEPVMAALKQTFGDSHRLVVVLTEELVKMPKIESETSETLRTFALAVSNFVANMHAVNLESELQSMFTLTVLEEKLSYWHRCQWTEIKKARETVNIEDFSQFLQQKMEDIPYIQPSSSAAGPSRSRRVNAHHPMKDRGSPQAKRQSLSCAGCDGSHHLSRCETFKSLPLNEKLDFVLDKKICISCLKAKHNLKSCQDYRKCNLDGCRFPHHRILHGAKSRNYFKKVEESASSSRQPPLKATAKDFTPRNDPKSSDIVLSHFEPESPVYFKILPVRLHGVNKRYIDTFAFLDDGSSVTLMEKNLFDELGLSGTPEELNIQWTKGVTRREESTRLAICVSNPEKRQLFRLTNVFTFENLDLPTQSYDAEDLRRKYRHLKGLPFPTLKNAKPGILIGLHHARLLAGRSIESGRELDPIAMKTSLGWVIFGNASPTLIANSATPHSSTAVQLHIDQKSHFDAETHQLVKDFFSTESFGVTASSKNLESAETIRAAELLSSTLRLESGRYEIGLLWRDTNISMPDSYSMALKRLVSFENSLLRTNKLDWMKNHVSELLKKNYARKATPEDLDTTWPRIWYCPMFLTFNENKVPPKPRVVMDPAACSYGQSLNSQLLKGPDNLAPLLKGLMKFRENAIAINADVKEMFHQVLIRKEDQQCQRFLWRDGDQTSKPDVYIMQVMMFGPTCSPACAQFVKNEHAKLFAGRYPEAAKAITDYTYVDDLLNSQPNIETAFALVQQVLEIFESMSFPLVSFQSNSQELLKLIPPEKVKTLLVDLEPDSPTDNISKILGMFWDTTTDMFTYRLSKNELMTKMLNREIVPTKREVLKIQMKIYDPLGLISNFLIRGRIILQEIWREGIDWDEKLTEPLQVRWQAFVDTLPSLEKLRIPRQYARLDPHNARVQLIIFVDASEMAFSAVGYFRFSGGSIEKPQVALAMAKAKVAPIKPLTIPQLELQAAVLGSRLATSIRDITSFTIHETKFLSDSRVVLAWLCSTKFNFKTFIKSRVGEILESTDSSQWFHVGTKENVADDATKPNDSDMSNNNSRWLNGPEFLVTDEVAWPIKAAKDFASTPAEATTSKMLLISQRTAKTHHMMINPEVFDRISSRHQSRWTQLVRTVAFMLRVHDYFLSGKRFHNNIVSPIEFERAELEIFKKIQLDAFTKEVNHFLTYGEIEPFNFVSSLSTFSPSMQEGLIIMNSRAKKANISYAARHPPILPNKHRYVDLLIQHLHEENMHMGLEMTIADAREKAWIINARSAVSRCARACGRCDFERKKLSRPVHPRMGDLPVARIDFENDPFTHTGVDAFGPYEVTIGRSTVKRWGMIFTCLTYRCVHLEVLDDMTSEECLLAIERFRCRRGDCFELYSDQGSNFLGASNLLHKDLAELQNDLSPAVSKQFATTWHFQPAYSPWWGGAWERLIQSIKKCTAYVMTSEKPTDAVFRNALIKAEAWMNRRPLTHLSIDHEDAPPLTPLSAIHKRYREYTALPRAVLPTDKFSRRKTRRVDHLANKFLNRWTREFLPEIAKRDKWTAPTPPIQKDDIVIVVDPGNPRNAWRKAKVTALHPGSDGLVRSTDVIFADRSTKRNVSVGRLIRLEVQTPLTPSGATERPDHVV